MDQWDPYICSTCHFKHPEHLCNIGSDSRVNCVFNCVNLLWKPSAGMPDENAPIFDLQELMDTDISDSTTEDIITPKHLYRYAPAENEAKLRELCDTYPLYSLCHRITMTFCGISLHANKIRYRQLNLRIRSYSRRTTICMIVP